MPMKSFGHSIFKLRVAQLSAAAVVVVLVIVAASPVVTSAAADASRLAEGAGQTIIEGGTGGTSPTPVTTTVAFHATNLGGDFECLALAPPSPSGSAGSGIFSVNAMYVTGKVTSLEVNRNTATLRTFHEILIDGHLTVR